MDSQKQQVAERVKEANNILVTVSANPSVDQLAACIGITLALNKMGKHATAVFSGQVPSILEFLQPEKTIEKNTDSLRDFIIALDKSKADKLRYKVEDRVVKIFITPYRTSISDKDLEFSQGDFNVDVVLALGVHNQSDLDHAITAHGRILHDATVITLNNKPGGELGVLNWLDPTASSLSELAMELVDMLDRSIVDEQIATAMLTGIVAETERFSNAKTTPRTMSISAELMTAGANQQLVATKLEAPAPEIEPAKPSGPGADQSAHLQLPAKKVDDGTLEISHDEPSDNDATPDHPEPAVLPEPKAPTSQQGELVDESSNSPVDPPQIHIDEHGSLRPLDNPPGDHHADKEPPAISHHAEAPKMILEPPTLGGQLTASGMPDAYELLPSDPLTMPARDETATPSLSVAPTIMPLADEPDDSGKEPAAKTEEPAVPVATTVDEPARTEEQPLPQSGKTLTEIERDVHSSHMDALSEPSPQSQTLPAPQLPSIGAPMPAAAGSPQVFTPPPAPAKDDVSMFASPPPPASDMASVLADDASNLQDARNAVEQAINSTVPQNLPPIEALNAHPLDVSVAPAPEVLPPVAQAPDVPIPTMTQQPAWAPAPTPAGQPFQPAFTAAPAGQPPIAPGAFPGTMPVPQANVPAPVNPNAPPPVPPPMMPPAF